MNILIRKAVSKTIAPQLSSFTEKAVAWLQPKYPDVTFDNVRFIFGTGVRARYFRNEVPNGSHIEPTVFISTNRDFVMLYWKPSLGMVRKEVTNVGHEDSIMTQLVHELTHHVQYERGVRKGNETDTTENELLWLKEFRPDVFELFTNL